jgi:PRC-barrel domain
MGVPAEAIVYLLAMAAFDLTAVGAGCAVEQTRRPVSPTNVLISHALSVPGQRHPTRIQTMNMNPSRVALAALAVLATLCTSSLVSAQVAGSTTTVEASVTESTRLAMGWSVKKTLMGKTIYNDAGVKVGKVEDLIISPDKSLSYVIIGAGGFVGIGRHDVAIPVTQIQDRSGKLVMAGASKDSIKAMPEFTYATDTTRRDAFVAAADKDIADGKAAVANLERKAGTAVAGAKTKIDADIAALQLDVRSAESKLSALKQATAVRWKEFEAEVSAATARLRKSTEKALG